MSNSDRKKNQLELRYHNSVQGPFFKIELLTVPSLLNLSMWKLIVLRPVSFLFKCKLPSSHLLVAPLQTTGCEGQYTTGRVQFI